MSSGRWISRTSWDTILEISRTKYINSTMSSRVSNNKRPQVSLLAHCRHTGTKNISLKQSSLHRQRKITEMSPSIQSLRLTFITILITKLSGMSKELQRWLAIIPVQNIEKNSSRLTPEPGTNKSPSPTTVLPARRTQQLNRKLHQQKEVVILWANK